MNFSAFFINRPRFAIVISLVMVLLGIMAVFVLPIAQYPDITPPQIIVEATYPGASAQTLVETVAIPIENQINGVEDMLYMESSCNDNGSYSLTITFAIGTDPDMAQVKVENRLQQVNADLPDISSTLVRSLLSEGLCAYPYISESIIKETSEIYKNCNDYTI